MNSFHLSGLVFVLSLCTLSCKQKQSASEDVITPPRTMMYLTLSRYTSNNGSPDDLSFSGYIIRTYDGSGKETKSIYYTADSSVMMQFMNVYIGDKKTRVNWMDGQDKMVRYVENVYSNNQLVRSDSYSPDNKYITGFIHQWKENGKVEEKGPAVEGQMFRPNAIYTYNDKKEFESLKEYDENDALIDVTTWKYTKTDDQGNWTERYRYTDDVLNMVERREIAYW